MSNTKPVPLTREQLFDRFMANAAYGDNASFLAAMMASWYSDEGVLPALMGLTPESFADMRDRYFPFTELPLPPVRAGEWQAEMPEYGELFSLLEHYAVDRDPERGWIAAALIAGCTGHHHLWEDLGLFCRADLTAMIAVNFPVLAVKNSRDMKWKKFIYKQLCEREGIIACPAPTCDACADFKICFASEKEPTDIA